MRSSRALNSMFLRSGDKRDDFRPGNTFRRVLPHNLVETAEILAVSTDDAGIPHVRFSVRHEHPARSQCDTAERMLALRTFADRYRG